MQLADIHPGLGDYLDLERHRNEGSPSGFSHQYRPKIGLRDLDRGDHQFELPLFEIENLTFVGAPPNHPVLFPVHPDMAAEFQALTGTNATSSTLASATSSGRTLLAEVMGELQFVKLSYHGLLGRVHRRMTRDHLLTAIEVSEAMRRSIAATPIDRFSIQHEYFGATADSHDGWGFVLRDLQPFPHPKFDYRVPAFSLLSSRFGANRVVPLLVEILQLRHDLHEPGSFYREFVQPIIDAYFLLLQREGLQIEAHAQNLVYHFDHEWKVATIVYRDMESVDKDLALIDELGIESPITRIEHKALTRRDPNYAIKHSFMYDFKLGEYLLRPLCDLWATSTRQSVDALHELIRQGARSHLASLPSDLFPADWYDYRAEVFEGQVGRPYIAHPSPSFR